ncbi:MAG: hypothetical protein AAGA28_04460 [Pseudomonadota bacterium]
MAWVVGFDKDGAIDAWHGFSGKIVTRRSYATRIAESEEAQKVADEWNDHFRKTAQDMQAVVLSTDDAAFSDADDT